MGRRARTITILLAIVTIACGVTTLAAIQGRSEAEDHQDALEAQLSDTSSEIEALRTEVDALTDTQADLAAAEALTAMFTPNALTAVAQVQTESIEGACATARTATRNEAALPTGEAAVAYAVATAPVTHEALNGLAPLWGRMVDPDPVQAEIDRCAADERAIMDAEAAAADVEARIAAEAAAAPDLNTCDGYLAAVLNAGRPPSSGEVQYLFINCGIDIAGG